MDRKEFKERYNITDTENLEVEEIFVAANRHNVAQAHEFHPLTDNGYHKSNNDKFGESEASSMSDEVHIDCYSTQKTVETDDEQSVLTGEVPEKWEYSQRSGIQQNTDPTNFTFQSYNKAAPSPQQHTDRINSPFQYYNRVASGNRELNLMTDGVFIVQHNSQRFDVSHNELNPTIRIQEEWGFPDKYRQDRSFQAKDEGNLFEYHHDMSVNIGKDPLQNLQKLEVPSDEPNLTEKLFEQWKVRDISGRDHNDIVKNENSCENYIENISDQANSNRNMQEKWETTDKTKEGDRLLAKDIENALKNHRKIISKGKDKTFTLEMEFSPMDLPFNIRVEPSEESEGFTASVANIDTDECLKAPGTPAIIRDKKSSSEAGNRIKSVKNPLGVDIEVVPLAVDQNFVADVDKSVFREHCVRRILKDDHKTRQPMESISIEQSSSKNQPRVPIFLRDTPTKSVDEFKQELNTRESVFDRDFTRTKPNDVLQSWVQIMEGFLEDQKRQLRRKMYQIDREEALERENRHHNGRIASKNTYNNDESDNFEQIRNNEGINEANRMISRTQLYRSCLPKAVHQERRKTTDTAKKQGIMKNVEKKVNGTTHKSQPHKGRSKDSKKGKKKAVEKQGPAVYKPKGPVFRPPPLRVDKEKKSFVKDVENPIIRISHGFGLIRKIPI
ncbi:uncharacterized protein LOC111051778 isoform X2 [Nilaparvata lugens]|uniref:uncharacterized protein LOC111051778 isoform X2 n=1 Tax=Nilaparvata lugens TaxID=108931 RepID=UPI00193E6A54|nr:uncharacterized protein LOC111051778 isoform X2 [Nilaparvata lugens]